MPELPEVETIVRALNPAVSGLFINELELLHPRVYRRSDSQHLVNKIKGKKISKISRRGKYLQFFLDSETPTFAIHLGMSGQLIMSDKYLESKHVRAVFHLSNKNFLNFVDIRTFGLIFPTGENEPPGYRRLGIEPLSAELTARKLESLYSRSHKVLKTLMLQQELVVGIGNIYASEALFRSGIHPERFADDISSAEYKKLHRIIRRILKEAIEQMGTTFSDYRRPDGTAGEFSNKLTVYGRTDEPCLICKTKIERINQHGRSTFFCPQCQK